ncbi:MAG: glycosyl transferase family 2 [Myxococcales bacterium]|nr:glycosyl transferase family 2 [Myxococcales bacterium]
MNQPLESAPASGPRASIVIPTYRRTDDLRALLDTLVPEASAASNFEVIVSDDGSGAEVADMAAAYASRFPRFKYITGENAGPGVARNRGVAAASSDVLLFVDSDCLVEPGWADALARAIEGGASIAFGPTRSPVPRLEPFVHSIFFEDELVGATNMAFARRTYESLGGFRPEISRFAEDRDLFTRARAAGHVPLRVAEAVVNHPPRLKKIRVPPLLGDAPYLSDLRAFYSLHPDVREEDQRSNRALLAKGTLKLLVGMTPLGLPTFVAQALIRRRDVNRCLAAAHIDFRVPAGEALKYGLLQPVNDILNWAIQALQMSAR